MAAIAWSATAKPLQVYILAGQSNMEMRLSTTGAKEVIAGAQNLSAGGSALGTSFSLPPTVPAGSPWVYPIGTTTKNFPILKGSHVFTVVVPDVANVSPDVPPEAVAAAIVTADPAKSRAVRRLVAQATMGCTAAGPSRAARARLVATPASLDALGLPCSAIVRPAWPRLANC